MSPLLAPGASPEALVERLRALPGIGPWTAHYIAMRALGWPDAFPPGDIAALKAMRQLFAIDTARAAEAHAEVVASVARLRPASSLEFTWESTP